MISNVDLWNLIREEYPNFASHTAKGTSDLFTARGFEALQRSDIGTLNEFFQLSLRVILNRVDFSNAKDILNEVDFGESFATPYGGYLQRIAVNSVLPVSPAYKGLANGSDPSPFVVKKGELTERFFEQNFDYQALLTIPDESLYKNMFVSEYGMSEVYSGFMQGLANAWTLQKYANKMEAINAYLNSIKYPIKTTQYINVGVAGITPTDTELVDMWTKIKTMISAMVNAPQSGAFNALGYKSTQDRGSLRILMRQGYKPLFEAYVLSGAFHPDYLGLDMPIAEVPNFGGLTPYANVGLTTPLYPVYDSLGTIIGYNTTQGATTVTVEIDDVHWKDPNEDIIAIIADRALVFESTQNGYQVEPIRNPRGLYTNFWASSPNNFVGVDPLYNCLIVRKATEVAETQTVTNVTTPVVTI